MELYNSEYVYFDWDDALEGKKGFFSDNINDLKQCVQENREDRFGKVRHIENSGFPFKAIDYDSSFKFFYYDPYYEFRKAYLEGKRLQYKHKDGWEDVIGVPLFNGDEYRIKPDEYVPFDTVQELIDAWDEKYPQNKNRPEGTMPLIWIKQKLKNRVYLITDFLFDKSFDCDVGTEDENIQLKELFKDYTFADGTVIGKKNYRG